MSLAELATRRTFRSLRVRNYRLFFFGQLVSVSGTWMQQLAQDWLVLRLTNRSLPVGIATALQFLPVLLLGVWGGVVADRLDKRKILLVTQATMCTFAVALGLLTLTGVVRLWMVYLLALLLGCTTAFDNPARQAFVSEMVGPDHVANAVGLNSALFNSARVIGPAAAGVLIAAFGVAPAFLVNGVSYLAVIGSLVAMDPARLYRQAHAGRGRGQVREGLRYAWGDPVLRSTLLMVTIIGTFALNYRVLVPLLARFTYHGGPELYGLLASVMAVGSVVGALYAAGRARPTRPLLLGAAAAFGVASILAALAPSAAWSAAALVLVGVSSIAFITTANSTLQLTASPRMRGRVMSLYGLLFLGSTPFGSLLVGWLAERYGPRSGFWLAAVCCLATAAVAALAHRRRAAATAEHAARTTSGQAA